MHIVKWLIEEAHANVHASSGCGRTAFWYCALNRNLKVAQYMLEHGADPRAPDAHGHPPFWAACFFNNMRMIQWLALVVDVGDDVTSESFISHELETWLGPFLQRRVLVAHWGAGRTRERCGPPGPGNTAEAVVWQRLPREALAGVLLMLAPPPI